MRESRGAVLVTFTLAFSALLSQTACDRHDNSLTSDGGAGNDQLSPNQTPPVCRFGAGFVTVDDFAPSAGQMTAVGAVGGVSSAAPRSGALWVLGQGSDAQRPSYWLASKSTDGGASWSMVTSFQAPGNGVMAAGQMCTDNSGSTYVAGWVQDNAAIEHWLVQKSADQGGTWGIAENYAYAPGHVAVANAVRNDGQGALYATGFGNDVDDTRHWVVRRSVDAGVTWSLTDDFIYFGGVRAEANDMIADSVGNLYVIGFGNDGKTNTSHHWLVRSSTDRGSTWNSVDDFQYAPTQQAIPYGIFVDAEDNLYVVGTAEDAAQNSHWIVRKSADQGQTFATIDDYQLAPQADSFGLALLADSSGNLYAVGEGHDATGVSHFQVRKSDNAGMTWSVIDDQVGPFKTGAAGRGIGRDGAGDLFAAGFYLDAKGGQHGMVRKMACN